MTSMNSPHLCEPPSLAIDGAVATITLRRPQVANRLEPQDLEVLMSHVAQVNASPVLVLRLQAVGRHFCGGFDIGKIGAAGEGIRFEDMVNAFEDCRPVTVAVIQGGVYGGATDLALACDFRIGGQRAEMFMPAARLGLHFYQRGLERYVSRLGLDVAKRLFLSAEKLDAGAMRECGFLTERVSDEALDARAQALCDTLAAMAPLAVTGMKKHLNRIARGRLDAAELQADIERTIRSQDLQEGARAWREKRAPRFTGN
jgi:enoyl-CoA hydratase/carnithine racemase